MTCRPAGEAADHPSSVAVDVGVEVDLNLRGARAAADLTQADGDLAADAVEGAGQLLSSRATGKTGATAPHSGEGGPADALDDRRRPQHRPADQCASPEYLSPRKTRVVTDRHWLPPSGVTLSLVVDEFLPQAVPHSRGDQVPRPPIQKGHFCCCVTLPDPSRHRLDERSLTVSDFRLSSARKSWTSRRMAASPGTAVSEPRHHPRGHLVVVPARSEAPPDQRPGDVQVVQRRGASLPDDALRPEVLGDRLASSVRHRVTGSSVTRHEGLDRVDRSLEVACDQPVGRRRTGPAGPAPAGAGRPRC